MTTDRNAAGSWMAKRLNDAVIFAAGLALALPLILPFA